AFAEKNNINFPLLSDYNRDVVKQYNIALNDFAGLKGYTAAKRSIFILDSRGNVIYRWVSDDPGKEPNYDEVRKAAEKTSPVQTAPTKTQSSISRLSTSPFSLLQKFQSQRHIFSGFIMSEIDVGL